MATAASPLGLATSLAGTGASLIMGLLAAHDKRVQAAKEENAAVGQAVSALDSDLKTIFTALNNGDITEAVAIATLTDVHLWYWSFIGPLQQGSTKGPRQPFPQANLTTVAGVIIGCYGDGAYSSSCVCDGKACTAGCCVGCGAIDPTLSAAVKVVQNHGGTFQRCVVIANKYGLSGSAAYNLTYKKPAKLQAEAEVTLNVKTGTVTVGAAPGANDAVIASGVVAIGSTPDSGGDVIQHDASGNDVNTTSLVAGIPGGDTTILLAAGALLLLLLIPGKK